MNTLKYSLEYLEALYFRLAVEKYDRISDLRKLIDSFKEKYC